MSNTPRRPEREAELRPSKTLTGESLDVIRGLSFPFSPCRGPSEVRLVPTALHHCSRGIGKRRRQRSGTPAAHSFSRAQREGIRSSSASHHCPPPHRQALAAAKALPSPAAGSRPASSRLRSSRQPHLPEHSHERATIPRWPSAPRRQGPGQSLSWGGVPDRRDPQCQEAHGLSVSAPFRRRQIPSGPCRRSRPRPSFDCHRGG
eukprot:scaffold1307_cov200-Pinguiococcus_pyrenoidosus.AAC.113